MSGVSETRVDGVDKVTGRAQYSADVRLPGLLYARVLRCPLPSARVRRIDVSRAAAAPGVHAVLCRDNAPPISWYQDSALFAADLRFAGDEVAAIAAESEAQAEDALRLIEVDYEPQPFDVCPVAPLAQFADDEAELRGRGDVAAGRAQADVVIDDQYTTQTALHNALEPHGCTAVWEDDLLTLYESTQGVFSVRADVAEKLGLPETAVRVVTRHMGGGFGAKQIAWKHSVIAALLARDAGRPVQLMLDREAENLAVGNRQATWQHLRLGARRDGTLTFIEAKLVMNRGAYHAGGESSMVAGMYLTLYRCPNVSIMERTLETNVGPAVAFRAPGYVEAAFALESAMDALARALDLDPVALRRMNHVDCDQNSGKPYSAPDRLLRCYDQVTRAFGWNTWRRPAPANGKRRGIGFAAHNWQGGSGNPPARVRVIRQPEGTARVIAGTQDIGTGTRTALAQIAAQALNLPLSQVSVTIGDTADGLFAPVSSGSATLATLGPAVRDAARAAATSPEGSAERAANPDDVTIQTCGAQCVEVEVDVETGEVTVLRVVAAHDCGRVVNPRLVESQVIGGITQGLGYALYEHRVVDAPLGLVLNANLEEYKVPTVADIPDIVDATESMPDARANALGVKGIGEPPIIPIAPAIANAVFDATGVRVHALPILRERLLP
jgi:CO/xanthine dehydrogenase Mo-binding subunit